MVEAKEVRVRGTVQGVGFRPTVWRLARAHALCGEVLNDAEGVLIRITGKGRDIAAFLEGLPREAPPLARIDAIEVRAVDLRGYQGFQISHSSAGGSHTGVSADAATCRQCAEEIDDPANRRHAYPFTNCTHCGPRLSIIEGIPYDRGNTTMAGFPMCPQCRAEYEDPADRRFHAQPNACHRCGPGIFLEWTEDSGAAPSTEAAGADPAGHTRHCLSQVVAALRQGKIIAIRGIGGFHLCCDAGNDAAVRRLRLRKHRYAKPFALMAPDVDCIESYCRVSAQERGHLSGASAPIVLLDKKASGGLSGQVAPGCGLLGFMLPYTPLHRLVSHGFGGPLVMTSGNLSDEPQIIDNGEARAKLARIADGILFHNRDIANRIDDSVLRCMAGQGRLLRRARGYAPQAIRLPPGFESSPELLAYGGELKSTFCLLKNGEAVLSQHQGDLEDAATFEDYEKNLALYQRLFDHRPRILVADKHPEYLSSKLARQTFAAGQARESRGDAPPRLVEVQHHHAHIASCLVENGVPIDTPAVLGIALDGLGYGEDGALWGGEFLLADYLDYRRVGAFKAVAMPGGFKAIVEPWRNTYAHILAAMGWPAFKERYGSGGLCAYLETKPLALLDQMLAGRLNAPLASSCGRLFDAVAAALGLCRDQALFEGQGAIELEARVDPARLGEAAYPFDIRASHPGPEPFFTLDPASLWTALLDDLGRGGTETQAATRFHAGLVQAVLDMVRRLGEVYPFTRVALSGGCLQNKFLLEGLDAGLKAQGLQCLTQARVPSNDGGLSLGQAAVGAARALAGASPPPTAKLA